MRKEQECKTNECSSKRNLPTKEEIAEMREKLALQDNIGRGTGFILKGSHQKDTGIECGREQTCCGRSTPCETHPCDKL